MRNLTVTAPASPASVTPMALAAKSSQLPLRVVVRYSCISSSTPLIAMGARKAQKKSFP
jgi:hypothetical protein